ncbi:phage portal protein, partial [Lactobacillus iners]
RENIFLFGQGIDPANFESSNASGVAIKMLYSHLELKAAKTQTYFEHAINELVRAIMHYLKFSDADKRHISQHWTRTKVDDSLTKAQIVSTVANYSSKEAVAKANPIVDD